MPLATPRALFVQAPVTAAAACFVLSLERMPERQAPLIKPLFKASAHPQRTAVLVLMEMVLPEVAADADVVAAPPPRAMKGVAASMPVFL